jgi:hypothetical protein
MELNLKSERTQATHAETTTRIVLLVLTNTLVDAMVACLLVL